VAESKGGLTIMLAALQALRFARRLRRIRCGILLTTDDTLGGQFSKKLVVEFANKSKYVIGLKYGDPDGGLVTSCSGRANFQFELTNIKGTHVTKVPDVIRTICQKMVAWQKLTAEDMGIIVKPLSLEARTLYGIAPDYATGSIMMLFNEKSQGDALEKDIRQIAKRNLGTKLQIRVRKSVARPPLMENDEIKQFFNSVQKIAQRLEVKIKSAHRSTSSDICHVSGEIPVLDGFGPVGGESRSPYEYIMRDSLIDRAALLAMVIRETAMEALP
jgi:D-alanine-D-alanine ligase